MATTTTESYLKKRCSIDHSSMATSRKVNNHLPSPPLFHQDEYRVIILPKMSSHLCCHYINSNGFSIFCCQTSSLSSSRWSTFKIDDFLVFSGVFLKTDRCLCCGCTRTMLGNSFRTEGRHRAIGFGPFLVLCSETSADFFVQT